MFCVRADLVLGACVHRLFCLAMSIGHLKIIDWLVCANLDQKHDLYLLDFLLTAIVSFGKHFGVMLLAPLLSFFQGTPAYYVCSVFTLRW